MNTIKKILAWIGVVAVVATLILIACKTAYNRGIKTGENRAFERIIAQSDTIYLRDTITLLKPQEKAVLMRDTVWLPVPDSLLEKEHIKDTVFVPFPAETKVYADSTYYAEVSGVNPSLDVIKVYPLTTIVNNSEIRTVTVPGKWGIGIQAGVGVGYNQGFRAFPYIGIGVQYNLLSLKK